jgi:hypothetical protein
MKENQEDEKTSQNEYRKGAKKPVRTSEEESRIRFFVNNDSEESLDEPLEEPNTLLLTY